MGEARILATSTSTTTLASGMMRFSAAGSAAQARAGSRLAKARRFRQIDTFRVLSILSVNKCSGCETSHRWIASDGSIDHLRQGFARDFVGLLGAKLLQLVAQFRARIRQDGNRQERGIAR